MRLSLNTAPAAEPVLIADLEAHCRLGTGGIAAAGQTATATMFLAAARMRAEEITRRQLITATWDMILDGFPGGREPIEIPLPPLQSITSISYIDPAGTTQTMSASLYRVIKETGPTVGQATTYPPYAHPGIVLPVYGQSWPSTLDDLAVVTIRFVAGYGSAGSAVPDGIRNWILLNAANLWENRETVVIGKGQEFNLTKTIADGLLTNYRIYRW